MSELDDLPRLMRSIVIETEQGPVTIRDWVYRGGHRVFLFERKGELAFEIDAESMHHVLNWMEQLTGDHVNATGDLK